MHVKDKVENQSKINCNSLLKTKNLKQLSEKENRLNKNA